MIKIAPSILSADFSKLGAEVKAVEDAGADWIHIDVMDGHFVPNITVGPLVVEAVRKVTRLPLDVHLMIKDADRYVKDFVQAGADILTVHVETCPHLHRTIHYIRDLGARPGVVLNPSTPLSSLEEILHDIDLVLLMSVNPGFGGQTFIPSLLDKTLNLREIMEHYDHQFDLEVDGGIKVENAAEIKEAGANVLVAGTAIFGSDDYETTIRQLRES